MSHRGAAHRAIASRKVQPATGLRYPTGWAVVNQPPGKHDRCPIPCLPTREIDGDPTPRALRSDDTHAPSGVAYDPMSPGSAFMLPHPFADERLSPSARERVRAPGPHLVRHRPRHTLLRARRLGRGEATRAPSPRMGVAGGKLRSGAIELVRSVPHRTVEDSIASSNSE